MIRRYWPLLVAFCVLVVAGLAYGWQTDRWGTSADVQVAAARLETLPMRVGDWEAVIVELPAEQVKAARAAGLTARRYVHRYTRAEIMIMLVCGRPGPVAVHSPDICYQGAGFL